MSNDLDLIKPPVPFFPKMTNITRCKMILKIYEKLERSRDHDFSRIVNSSIKMRIWTINHWHEVHLLNPRTAYTYGSVGQVTALHSKRSQSKTSFGYWDLRTTRNHEYGTINVLNVTWSWSILINWKVFLFFFFMKLL